MGNYILDIQYLPLRPKTFFSPQLLQTCGNFFGCVHFYFRHISSHILTISFPFSLRIRSFGSGSLKKKLGNESQFSVFNQIQNACEIKVLFQSIQTIYVQTYLWMNIVVHRRSCVVNIYNTFVAYYNYFCISELEAVILFTYVLNDGRAKWSIETALNKNWQSLGEPQNKFFLQWPAPYPPRAFFLVARPSPLSSRATEKRFFCGFPSELCRSYLQVFAKEPAPLMAGWVVTVNLNYAHFTNILHRYLFKKKNFLNITANFQMVKSVYRKREFARKKVLI